MSSQTSSNGPFNLQEFLTFRRMVTPVIIQVVFWIGIVLIAIAALGLMVEGSGFLGLLVFLLGPVAWRVYVELLIVIFRIHSGIEDANASLRTIAAGARSQEPPPPLG